jgi:hypothetical protein
VPERTQRRCTVLRELPQLLLVLLQQHYCWCCSSRTRIRHNRSSTVCTAATITLMSYQCLSPSTLASNGSLCTCVQQWQQQQLHGPHQCHTTVVPAANSKEKPTYAAEILVHLCASQSTQQCYSTAATCIACCKSTAGNLAAVELNCCAINMLPELSHCHCTHVGSPNSTLLYCISSRQLIPYTWNTVLRQLAAALASQIERATALGRALQCCRSSPRIQLPRIGR